MFPRRVEYKHGGFFLRSNQWTETFITRWMDEGFQENDDYSVNFLSGRKINNLEQSAFVNLYERNWNNVMVHTEIIDPVVANAHLQRELWRTPLRREVQYRPGVSWNIHLAGIPNEQRVELAKNIHSKTSNNVAVKVVTWNRSRPGFFWTPQDSEK